MRISSSMISELNPSPTEQICQQFNELRSDIVLCYELRSALSTCDYELQSLRHQYEALAPGKVSLLQIPSHSIFITTRFNF